MPSEVYVIGEVNAWVAQCGGWMGLGGKRVMGLGLPMLRALTVPEFQAVLAHEFGHVHGGDTRLGRIVYQTRAAIGRTVAGLAEQESWLQIPFLTYARLFLRVSHAVSRSQESTADRLAASIVGRGALAEGLRKIHGAAFVYERYWNDEVRAVVEAGYLPPLMEGFGRYLSGEVGVALARAAVEHAVASEEADIYDTHPPLRERLEALGNFPGGMDASAAGRRSNSSGTCGRWSRSCSVGHWRQPRAGR